MFRKTMFALTAAVALGAAALAPTSASAWGFHGGWGHGGWGHGGWGPRVGFYGGGYVGSYSARMDYACNRNEERGSQKKSDHPRIKRVAVRNADPVKKDDAHVIVNQIEGITHQSDVRERPQKFYDGRRGLNGHREHHCGNGDPQHHGARQFCRR